MPTSKLDCAHGKHLKDCIKCWPAFCEITEYTIEDRALAWALGNDTGVSSKTLARFMCSIYPDGLFYESPPSDADDRGRCIRLLKLIPEWLPRLPELARANPGAPTTVNGRTDHNDTWAYQIPLILQEGGF